MLIIFLVRSIIVSYCYRQTSSWEINLLWVYISFYCRMEISSSYYWIQQHAWGWDRFYLYRSLSDDLNIYDVERLIELDIFIAFNGKFLLFEIVLITNLFLFNCMGNEFS